MHFLVSGCQGRTIEDSQEKQYKLLVHFEEHVHNKFNKYTFCFFFCELLNLSICALQIYAICILNLHLHFHHKHCFYVNGELICA